MELKPITAKVLAYIKKKYGAEPEFLWARTPNSAALRYKPNKKWFAALIADIPKATLKLEGEGRVDIINLKCDPLLKGSIVDGKSCVPAYHMNKEHWISVLLDGSMEFDDICALIDISYALIA